MQNVLGSLHTFHPTSFSKPRRQDEVFTKNSVHKVYPAYHEEDPPADAGPAPFGLVTMFLAPILPYWYQLEARDSIVSAQETKHYWGILDFDEGFEIGPMDAGGSNGPRLDKASAAEGIGGPQGLAAGAAAGAGLLKPPEPAEAGGMRRNVFSFEDSWLSKLSTRRSSHAVQMPEETDTFGDMTPDEEAAMMRRASGAGRRATCPALIVGKGVGDQQEGAGNTGLSQSTLMGWFSARRFSPASETISESPTGSTTDLTDSAEVDGGTKGLLASVAGTGATSAKPAAPMGSITAAASAFTASADASQLKAGALDPKKKSKMNYRDLNAMSPSYW